MLSIHKPINFVFAAAFNVTLYCIIFLNKAILSKLPMRLLLPQPADCSNFRVLLTYACYVVQDGLLPPTDICIVVTVWSISKNAASIEPLVSKILGGDL